MKTTELVESLLRETVESLGFTLCDVEFAKEYGNWVLTLYIDREGGVDLNDCERVSRAVDPILDREDPIEQTYYLSVSSLGLDRPLRKTPILRETWARSWSSGCMPRSKAGRNGWARWRRLMRKPLRFLSRMAVR